MRTVLIANGLGSRYRHTFIALDGDFAAAESLSPNTPSSCLALLPPKSGRLRPKAVAAFRNLLAAQEPDLLITYNWGAVEWALANRFFPLCPHLHFEDGFGPDENPLNQIPRRVWFRRIALTGNALIVVPSVTLWRVATERWGLNPDRVLYIPNGVDCARFAGADRPRESNRPLVGSIGRLRPEKNLGRLLRVAAAARTQLDFDLEIVGEGAERDGLEALASDLGLTANVVFFGDCRQPEERYRRFDVFALSSDTEQMPLSVLEAMAAGLPIVATDVGDVREMLAPENRPYVVPANDEAAFGERLLALLRDADLRGRIGEANRRRAVERFSLTRMLADYEELFEEVLVGEVRRRRDLLTARTG